MDVWAFLTSTATVQLIDMTYYDLDHIDWEALTVALLLRGYIEAGEQVFCRGSRFVEGLRSIV